MPDVVNVCSGVKILQINGQTVPMCDIRGELGMIVPDHASPFGEVNLFLNEGQLVIHL